MFIIIKIISRITSFFPNAYCVDSFRAYQGPPVSNVEHIGSMFHIQFQ